MSDRKKSTAPRPRPFDSIKVFEGPAFGPRELPAFLEVNRPDGVRSFEPVHAVLFDPILQAGCIDRDQLAGILGSLLLGRVSIRFAGDFHPSEESAERSQASPGAVTILGTSVGGGVQ